MTPAAPAHAAAMALIHAAAFPPAERWDAGALALHLTLPGGYGYLLLPASGKDRGEGALGHGPFGSRAGLPERRRCPAMQPNLLPSREPFHGSASEDEGGFILARVAADEAEVLTLAVTPSARSHGLGRQLLQAAMDQGRGRGALSVFLEVSPDNAPALALYARAGFVLVGRRPRYYAAGGDALVLRRALSPGAAAAGASHPAGA